MTRFFLTVFLIGCVALGRGQSAEQKKLEKRKAQIEKEIKSLNGLISKQDKKEQTVLGKISENDAKIKLSEKLISTTGRQTRLLTDDIYLNQLKINQLNRELKVLKEDYANMLLQAYKNRSEQSRIMFILSSENFLEAYKRVQYMKQYASFRKVQGDEIRGKMTELEDLVAKLSGQKTKKEKLLTQSEKEKVSLEKDKNAQEGLVKTIQRDKKKYAADIQKKENEARAIDEKIDRMIRDAIAAANKRTAADESANPESEAKSTKGAAALAPVNKIVLTKESKLVADNFKANKGRLPWPVEKGYISVHYGDQPHPVFDNLTIHSSGIEITTEEGAAARAVFAGVVMSVQIISGNKVVYIQHGDFITVYYNLESVTVGVGDKIALKQTIGRVATSSSGKTTIKFFVLQNTTYLNPQSWISPL